MEREHRTISFSPESIKEMLVARVAELHGGHAFTKVIMRQLVNGDFELTLYSGCWPDDRNCCSHGRSRR